MQNLLSKSYFDENIKFPLKNEDFYNKIKMFYKHKNSHLTICYALEVLDRNVKSSDTEFLPAPVWLNFGKALLIENEKVAAEYAFQKAIIEYKSLLEIYPNDNENKFNLASLFAYFDDLNSAKSILDSYLIFNSSKYMYYGFGFEKYKKDRNWQNYLFSDKIRRERVVKFSEVAKNEYSSIRSNLAIFQSGLDFILENSEEFPQNPQNADETYVFFHFIDLLNPIVFWTDFDLRILKVIQANYMFFSGRNYGLFENFVYYIYSHCYNINDYSKEHIDKILNKLFENGFDEIILVKSLILKYFDVLFDEKYQLTGFGSLVANYYFSSQPNEILIQTINEKYDSKKLEILLFLFDSQRFENQGNLEKINFKDSNSPKDKNLHCNIDFFKMLYFNNLEKKQTFLEYSYLQTTDIKSILELNKFLAEIQFPNYKSLIINHFEKNIDFIIKNYLNSKNYKIYIPKDLVFSLISHCPNEAKNLIFNWFPKLNGKEDYDYILFEKTFKEESIPVFLECFKISEFPKSSIFELLEKYDLTEFSEVFREKLRTYTNFPQEICNILVKNGDSEIPFAIELINDHSLQKQSLGLQILDSLNSEKSLQVIENLYFETQK